MPPAPEEPFLGVLPGHGCQNSDLPLRDPGFPGLCNSLNVEFWSRPDLMPEAGHLALCGTDTELHRSQVALQGKMASPHQGLSTTPPA